MNVLINKMGDIIVRGGFSGLTHLLTCVANNISKEIFKILHKNLAGIKGSHTLLGR